MRAKRSIYNLCFSIFSQAVTFAMGIIIPKLFIVNLGSETNGLVSSVGQVLAYVGLLEAGIGATVIQALYKPIVENDKERINRILSASNQYYKKIGVIYIGCILLVAILYPITVSTSIPVWQIVGVVFFSGMGNAINFLLQQNYVVLLAAEGKGYITTNINLIVNVLVSLSKAILLLFGFNVVCVLGAQFILSLVRILILRVYINKNYQWLNVNDIPDTSALSKQKYVMVQQLSYFVYSNTDIVVLTFLGNLKMVSVYVIYNMIVGAIEGIVGAFTSSVIFALGQLHNEDFPRFKKIFRIFDAGYTTIVFTLFTVVYLCITPFLSVYTRGITDVNYLDPKLALLFVILKMVSTLRSQSQNTIDFAGHFKETQNSAIAEAVLNILISLIGVYFIGIYGVVLGSIVSTMYRGIVVTRYAEKNILKVEADEQGRKFFRWVIYILTFVGIYFVSKSLVPSSVSGYFQWVCLAFACTAFSVALYGILWFAVDKENAIETVNLLLRRNSEK